MPEPEKSVALRRGWRSGAVSGISRKLCHWLLVRPPIPSTAASSSDSTRNTPATPVLANSPNTAVNARKNVEMVRNTVPFQKVVQGEFAGNNRRPETFRSKEQRSSDRLPIFSYGDLPASASWSRYAPSWMFCNSICSQAGDFFSNKRNLQTVIPHETRRSQSASVRRNVRQRF